MKYRALVLALALLAAVTACRTPAVPHSDASSAASLSPSSGSPASCSSSSSRPPPIMLPPVEVGEVIVGSTPPAYDRDYLGQDYRALPQEVQAQYPREQIVVYDRIEYKPSANIAYWQAWRKSFLRWEPASVLLYLDGDSMGGAFFELIADGTQTCTLRKYDWHGQQEYRSQLLGVNDFVDIFAADVEELWCGPAQTSKNAITMLYTKPIDVTTLDYDPTGGQPLGDTGPDEALQLAIQGVEDFNSWSVDWMISAGEPAPDPPAREQLQAKITGAVSLFGHPCYLLRIDAPAYDDTWFQEVAVNADGGNLVFICDKLAGNWHLVKDSRMLWRTPSKSP